MKIQTKMVLTEIPKELYTAKEVASRLGCSPSFIYELYKSGRLKGIRLGRRYIRFTEDAIRHLLSEELNK